MATKKRLSEGAAKSILGVAGDNTRTGQIRADEFIPELRGKNAIRKYREMRDNDSTIGAVMYAAEQVLRDVKLKVEPANDTEEAKREADFVESIFEDMDHSLDDHIAESYRRCRMALLGLRSYISEGLAQLRDHLRKTVSTLMDAWVYVRLLVVRLGQSLGLM